MQSCGACMGPSALHHPWWPRQTTMLTTICTATSHLPSHISQHSQRTPPAGLLLLSVAAAAASCRAPCPAIPPSLVTPLACLGVLMLALGLFAGRGC